MSTQEIIDLCNKLLAEGKDEEAKKIVDKLSVEQAQEIFEKLLKVG